MGNPVVFRSCICTVDFDICIDPVLAKEEIFIRYCANVFTMHCPAWNYVFVAYVVIPLFVAVLSADADTFYRNLLLAHKVICCLRNTCSAQESRKQDSIKKQEILLNFLFCKNAPRRVYLKRIFKSTSPSIPSTLPFSVYCHISIS